ncbi:MAG: TetR/AcrR family transcriptional regulator [Saprospiraceae bacterium]|nr:TetR/AcrR family transcriptional regulator [Saprospiraceae bacterium]
MKNKGKHQWIEKGYEAISEVGFTHVNIEFLARALNKNKSSFYYYFGDWDGFEEELLAHHYISGQVFAAEADSCKRIIPDMINLFLSNKNHIFFHKQLRIHRQKPKFKACFEAAYQMFEAAIIEQWASFLNMKEQPMLAGKILTLISENFLLQITHENFTYSWLKDYLFETSTLLTDTNSKAKK